jgi:hypothetical protein
MAASPLSLTALQRYLPGNGAYGATSPTNPVSLVPGAAGTPGGPAYVYPSGPASPASGLPNNNDALNKQNQDRANALMSLQNMTASQSDARLKAELRQKALDSEQNVMQSQALGRQQALDLDAKNTRDKIFGLVQNSLTNITGPGSSEGPGPQTHVPPTIPPPTAPSSVGVNGATAAAQGAAFGRAKAQAGALGRSAINSTAAELAGRGMSTQGGAFARRIADRVANATNPLADINVAQLGENATNARHDVDLSADMAKTGYEGSIAQRGQDVAQRGQDLSAQQAANALAIQKQQSLLSLLSGAMTRIY